jgi:hypothetical protein
MASSNNTDCLRHFDKYGAYEAICEVLKAQGAADVYAAEQV